MKKMMMAVAVVCSAVAVQAASVSWTSNNKQFCDATGTPVTSMTGGELVLVTLGSSIDWSAAVEIPTGTGTGTTTLNINQNAGNKMGRVTGTVSFDYTAGSDSNFIDNGDYLALMWKDATTGDLSKLVYTADGSDVEAVVQVSGLANNASALTGKAMSFSGNFAAVPEPTSGLLLLLGMAGLALRRKQA
jgi:hypothetical protein